jgi:hypothetical protein
MKIAISEFLLTTQDFPPIMLTTESMINKQTDIMANVKEQKCFLK